jgi:hypothetical protein
MAPIELRNGRAIEECQAMEVNEYICDFLIMSVDLAYPVHQPDLQNSAFNRIDLSPRTKTSIECKTPRGLFAQSGIVPRKKQLEPWFFKIISQPALDRTGVITSKMCRRTGWNLSG